MQTFTVDTTAQILRCSIHTLREAAKMFRVNRQPGHAIICNVQAEHLTHLDGEHARLLASLEDLCAWMRSHAGPAEDTQAMLTRAVEVITSAGGTVR